MKKATFLIMMLLLMLANGFAQKVDTLYYDLDGKGVPNKDFADIVMMAYYGEDESMNRFRAFYTSGEIYGKGGFASIDKRDVNKSQLKDFEIFYKSGKLLKSYKVDGIIEVRKEFYENGNYLRYDSLVNNKAEGMQYYDGSNDGKFVKCIEMREGNPVNPYYTIWNDGVPCNYYLEDNSICNEEVTEFSVKEGEYSDSDVKFYYYAVNGLIIRLASFSKLGNGKAKPSMFQIELVNKRNTGLEFLVENISARSSDNNKKEPYLLFDNKQKIGKRVTWEAAWHYSVLLKLPDSWLKDRIVKSDESMAGLFVLSASDNWDFIDVKLDNIIYSFPISEKYCNSANTHFAQ